MKNLTVKIDVDGVLRNISVRLIHIYNNFRVSTGSSNKEFTMEDFTSYNVNDMFPEFEKWVKMPADEYFFTQNSFQTLKLAPIYDGVKEAIDKLIANNINIAICTSQKTLDNKIHTLQWLDEHEIHYNDIYFTHDKYKVDCDFFIDDNPKFIMKEYDLHPERVNILIAHPYNKKLQNVINAVNSKQLKVANNFVEAVEIILNYAKNR